MLDRPCCGYGGRAGCARSRPGASACGVRSPATKGDWHPEHPVTGRRGIEAIERQRRRRIGGDRRGGRCRAEGRCCQGAVEARQESSRSHGYLNLLLFMRSSEISDRQLAAIRRPTVQTRKASRRRPAAKLVPDTRTLSVHSLKRDRRQPSRYYSEEKVRPTDLTSGSTEGSLPQIGSKTVAGDTLRWDLQ